MSDLLDIYLDDLEKGKIALVKNEKFFNGSYTETRDIVMPIGDIWVEGFKRAVKAELDQEKPTLGVSYPILPDYLSNIVTLPQSLTATYTDFVRLMNGDIFLSSLDGELVKYTNNYNSMVRYGFYDPTLSTDGSYDKVISVAVNPSESQIALTLGDTVQKIKIYSLPTFEFIREISDTEDLVGVAYRTDDELYYATTNKVVYDFIDTTTGNRDKKTLLEYGVNGFPSNLGVEDVKRIKVIDSKLWVSDSRDRLSLFTHVLDINNGNSLAFTGVTYNLLGKYFLDGNADILDFIVMDSFLFLLCEQDSKIYKVNLETHEVIDTIGNKTVLSYKDSLIDVKLNEWDNPIAFYVDENQVTVLDIGAKAILRGIVDNQMKIEYKLPTPPTSSLKIYNDGVYTVETEKENTVSILLNIKDKICPIFISYVQTQLSLTDEECDKIDLENKIVPTIIGENYE